jgi:YesN/AraC family two-component response regulator
VTRSDFPINQRLLYVEDEEDTLLEMRTFLKRRFSQVIVARTGEEALTKFQEFSPDLLITDLRLPGLGGLEVIRELRIRGFQGPVLITSAVDDVETILSSVDLGINKYMLKPLNTRELEEALLNLAGQLQHQDLSGLWMEEDKRKEYEEELSHQFSRFLKQNAGKGPGSVKLYFSETGVEVRAYDTLTLFEQTLLDRGRNGTMVEQNRQLFYQLKKGEMEGIVRAVTGLPVHLQEVRIDSLNRYDLLGFSRS